MEDPRNLWSLQQAAQKYEDAKYKYGKAIAEAKEIVQREMDEANPPSPYLPSFLTRVPAHPERMMENCAFKSAFGGVAGFGFGFVLGIFFASTAVDPLVDTGASTMQQVKDGFKGMYRHGMSSAKNFGKISIVFAGVECVIEKYRARTDLLNGPAAGCVTGGVFAARGGPAATALGCAGFAAFSAAIEWMLLTH